MTSPNDPVADFPPLRDDEWPAEIADMLGGFAGRLNVYRTMAHHPGLLRAWADLRDHVVNGSALGATNLEIVILRTGHRLASTYEWAHHVDRGRKVGLTDARILSIRGNPVDMIPSDALLAQGVDELFDIKRLSKETFAQVVETFGARAAFDLMATVGAYSTLGFILNSCETPVDDDVARRLAAHPIDRPER